MTEVIETVERFERRTVVQFANYAKGIGFDVRMQIVGEHGGCEFWFMCREHEDRDFGDTAMRPGGFEVHFKSHNRPEYYHDKPAHRNDCAITGGECWHDGTSLWAREYWLPGLRAYGADWVWTQLESEYRKQVAPPVSP